MLEVTPTLSDEEREFWLDFYEALDDEDKRKLAQAITDRLPPKLESSGPG